MGETFSKKRTEKSNKKTSLKRLFKKVWSNPINRAMGSNIIVIIFDIGKNSRKSIGTGRKTKMMGTFAL